MIKFAESTRLYILNGPEELRPEEYDSENLRKFRAQAKEREKQRILELEKEKELKEKQGIEEENMKKIKKSLTGTDEDVIKNLSKYKKVYHIEDNEDNEDNKKQTVNQDLLNPHERILYEKLEQLEKRKEKIEEKMSKLHKQSEYGFEDITDKQKRGLERDEKQLNDILEQISKIQDELEIINSQVSEEKDIADEYLDDEFDDTDEYYDRTLKQKKTVIKEVLNEETVSLKLKDINREIIEIKEKIKEAEFQQKNAIESVKSNNSDDPLDEFMKNTIHNIHSNDIKKLKAKYDELAKDQDKYLKMLKILISSIDFRSDDDINANETPRAILVATEKLIKNNNERINPVINNTHSSKITPPKDELSSKLMPPPPKSSKIMPPKDDSSSKLSTSENNLSSKLMPPPPKSSKIMPPPQQNSNPIQYPQKPNDIEKQLDDNESQTKKRKLSTPKDNKSKKQKQNNEKLQNEEEWIPPKDQTGDGHTKLNDLLGY